MTLPRIAGRDEWLRSPQGAARAGEAPDPRARRASTRRRELPMVEIEKGYRFEGPDGEAPARPLRGPPPADRLPLHVRARVGGGCPSCTAGADDCPEGTRRQLDVRDTTLRVRLPRPLRSSSATRRRGLDVPVVLVVRQRLQLRLRRHGRRVGRAGAYNYRTRERARGGGHRLLLRGRAADRAAGRAASCASTTASSTRTRRSARRRVDRRLLRLPRPDGARPPGGLGGAEGPRGERPRGRAELPDVTYRATCWPNAPASRSAAVCSSL